MIGPAKTSDYSMFSTRAFLPRCIMWHVRRHMRDGTSKTEFGFAACRSGASAVEFGLLAWPFLMMTMAVLQFYAMHIMQNTLSDALYQSAAAPEIELLAGQKDAYKAIVCAKTAFTDSCKASLVLEMQRLADVPTTSVALTEKFQAGTSNDVLLLRASTSVVQFVPFIPVLKIKASVIFRRPT